MNPTGRVRLRRTVAAAAGTVTLLAAVVSCAGTADDPDDADDPAPSQTTASDPPSSAAPTPTEQGTATTESAEPSQPAEPTPAPPSGTLRSALVPGAQLPPLNIENHWRTRATGRSEPTPPAWVCQPVSLVSNGAMTTWVRSYASAGTSTASQVVGEFADERSAIRAFGALQGNARDCAEELRDRGRRPVRPPAPLSDLPVPQGEAGWGVVFSGPVPGDPDAAHLDAVVVVRVGDRLSVVSMHSVGQDYNYPAGQTPPELAGPVVAARLAAG